MILGHYRKKKGSYDIDRAASHPETFRGRRLHCRAGGRDGGKRATLTSIIGCSDEKQMAADRKSRSVDIRDTKSCLTDVESVHLEDMHVQIAWRATPFDGKRAYFVCPEC